MIVNDRHPRGGRCQKEILGIRGSYLGARAHASAHAFGDEFNAQGPFRMRPASCILTKDPCMRLMRLVEGDSPPLTSGGRVGEFGQSGPWRRLSKKMRGMRRREWTRRFKDERLPLAYFLRNPHRHQRSAGARRRARSAPGDSVISARQLPGPWPDLTRSRKEGRLPLPVSHIPAGTTSSVYVSSDGDRMALISGVCLDGQPWKPRTTRKAKKLSCRQAMSAS